MALQDCCFCKGEDFLKSSLGILGLYSSLESGWNLLLHVLSHINREHGFADLEGSRNIGDISGEKTLNKCWVLFFFVSENFLSILCSVAWHMLVILKDVSGFSPWRKRKERKPDLAKSPLHWHPQLGVAVFCSCCILRQQSHTSCCDWQLGFWLAAGPG